MVYDRDKHAILGLTGGAWSLKDGKYEESIDFASDEVQQLRGKAFQFTIKLAGDKWDHKGVPGSEIEVDEVWSRMKQADDQKKNTGEPGRQLLGTWDVVFEPGAPKAIRTLKHITPTHWTWVTYDRENKRVLAAAGGTWSLRNGEYVEDLRLHHGQLPAARRELYAVRIPGRRRSMDPERRAQSRDPRRPDLDAAQVDRRPGYALTASTASSGDEVFAPRTSAKPTCLSSASYSPTVRSLPSV